MKEQNERKHAESCHQERGTGPEERRLAADEIADLGAAPTRGCKREEGEGTINPMPRILREDQQSYAEIECGDYD